MPRSPSRTARPSRSRASGGTIVEDAYYEEIADLLRTMPSDWRRQYRSGRDKLAAIGGPVLPDTPSPDQAMLLIGITAGGNPSGDTPYGPHRVPRAVREAAMQGIRLSHANNYGAWDFIGLARAIELVIVPSVSDTTFKRMGKYLFRHKKDALGANFGNDANPSRGYMAWLNWGGDPAVSWTRTFERNPLPLRRLFANGQHLARSRGLRRNPPVGMSDALGAIPLVQSFKDPTPVGVLLVAPKRRVSRDVTPFDVVGMLTFSVENQRAEVDRAAAHPGFGPLLYDAATYVAKMAGARALYPSTVRTQAAKGFWEQVPEGFMVPLSKEAFVAKYGGSFEDAVRRGLVYSPFTEVGLGETETGFWVGTYPFSDTLSERAKRKKLTPERAITPRQAAREHQTRAAARARAPQGTLALLQRKMNYGPDTGKVYLVLLDYLGDAPRGLSDIAAVAEYKDRDLEAGTFVGERKYVDMLFDLASVVESRLSPEDFRAKHEVSALEIIAAGDDIRRDFGPVSIPHLGKLWRQMVDFPSREPSVLDGDPSQEEPWITASRIFLPRREEEPLRIAAPPRPANRRLVRPNPDALEHIAAVVAKPPEKTGGEKVLSTAQTAVGTAAIAKVATKKLAPKVAARVGATAAGKLGSRAIPVLGEVLMLFGAGKEAYKVGKRRMRGERGSWKTDLAKVGAGAIGVEDFVPEYEPEPEKKPNRGRR